jgi:glutamine synthetase
MPKTISRNRIAPSSHSGNGRRKSTKSRTLEPVFATPEDLLVDDKEVARVKRQLTSAGVEFCFASYVDVHGVPKAKTTPISAFEKMARGSELFTVGAMDGMGLVGPQKDECAAVPELDRAVICPWDKRYAWFPSELYYHEAPYINDSRYILKQQIRRAAELGFVFNLGLEPEFYVLRTKDNAELPGILPSRRFKSVCPAYDVDQTLGSMEFLAPMARYLNELGWGLFSFDQEGGHGQFEFDCNCADVLTMCDRMIFLRLMAKQVADSIGAVATFMPKPFANDFRSGCHFNMSLADSVRGRNRFAPEPGGNEFAGRYGLNFSKLAYHFTAGLLRHAAALTAVTSPTYNSYQGLIAQGDMPDISWAPVLVAYGRNNRSAMIRMPMSRYCVENRAPDMSCNPYLAAALSLAAGLEGIEQELDPGEPLNEDCYSASRSQLTGHGVRFLPRTLLHAIEAFSEDPLVEQVFGSEFREIYIAQKTREWEQAFYKIHPGMLEDRLTFI